MGHATQQTVSLTKIHSHTVNDMNHQLPSLITTDAQAGLTLAGQLAAHLSAQLAQANATVERPGGMNYLLPAPVPPEITTGILFYAIAAANRGWGISPG